MRKLFRIAAIAALSLTFLPALAAAGTFNDWPDNWDYNDWHIGLEVHDGQLVTGWYTGRDGGLIGFAPSQVFLQQFGHTGVVGVADWGTNSGPGTFNTPSSVGFNLMEELHMWDGDTFVPTADATLTVNAGPETVQSGTGFVAGIPTQVRDEDSHPSSTGNWGRHHAHYLFWLDEEADDGIYFIKTEWFHTSSDQSVELAANAEPVWLVFGLNVDDEQLVTAANYVQTEVVPEPATLGLLAVGGVALLKRRRR